MECVCFRLQMRAGKHLYCWDPWIEGPNRVGARLLSPENGNRYSFRNAVFSIYLEFQTMERVHKPSDVANTFSSQDKYTFLCTLCWVRDLMEHSTNNCNAIGSVLSQQQDINPAPLPGLLMLAYCLSGVIMQQTNVAIFVSRHTPSVHMQCTVLCSLRYGCISYTFGHQTSVL
jgi:hypothetical protein